MSVMDRILRRSRGLDIPAFGGDVRPAVMGPANIKASLSRLAFIRTLLTAIILVVALTCAFLAWRTPRIMGTELFVADGSSLGCHVPSFYRE